MKEIIGKQKYVWLVVVCILAFFANAGVLDSDIMEARNLVTAGETAVAYVGGGHNRGRIA